VGGRKKESGRGRRRLFFLIVRGKKKIKLRGDIDHAQGKGRGGNKIVPVTRKETHTRDGGEKRHLTGGKKKKGGNVRRLTKIEEG